MMMCEDIDFSRQKPASPPIEMHVYAAKVLKPEYHKSMTILRNAVIIVLYQPVWMIKEKKIP